MSNFSCKCKDLFHLVKMTSKTKRPNLMSKFNFKLPEKLRRISAVSGGSSGPPTPRARGRRAAFSAVQFKIEKIMKQLQTGIEKGDTAQVEDVVEMVDISELEEGTLAFVRRACEHDNLDIVAVLLRNGASVNMMGEGNCAPIHVAARKGNSAMAAILLSNGANVNAQAKYEKKTPLHVATLEGHIDIIRLLVANGADVNMGDIYGSKPLHIACRMGRSNVIKILLDNHARIDSYDNEGWTGLHLAAESGHESIVKMLLEANANVDSQSKYGRTPLHWACVSGHAAVVHTLLQKGACANIKDLHDNLPIYYAKNDTIKTLVQLHTKKPDSSMIFVSSVGLYLHQKRDSSCSYRTISSGGDEQNSLFRRSQSSEPVMRPQSARSSLSAPDTIDSNMSPSKRHAYRVASSLVNSTRSTIIVHPEPDSENGENMFATVGHTKPDDKPGLGSSFQKLVGTTSGHLEGIGNAVTELDALLKLVSQKRIQLTPASLSEYINKIGDIGSNIKQLKHDFTQDTSNIGKLIEEVNNESGQLATGNPSYIALVQLFVQCLSNYLGNKEDGWKHLLNNLPVPEETSSIMAFQLQLKPVPSNTKVANVITYWARGCDAEQVGAYMKTLLQGLQKCKFEGEDIDHVDLVVEDLINLEKDYKSGSSENKPAKIAFLVSSLKEKDVRHMYNQVFSANTNLNVFPTLDELSVSESDTESPTKTSKAASVKSATEKLEDLLKEVVEEEDIKKQIVAVKYLIMSGHEELLTFLL